MEKPDLTPMVALFNDFFTSTYKSRIDSLLLVYPARRSLVVDYEELEMFDPDIADRLVSEPDNIIESAETAIKEMKLALPSGGEFEPHVRFVNVPAQELLIEQLSSKNLNELVAFKAVVTKRAEVMHRVKIAVYRCQICDSTSRYPVVKNFTPPKRCDSCKKLALKQVDEESDFVDIQRAEVQELLERVKGGAPTAKIELLLEDDLVNVVTPGENIELAGILRLKQPMKFRQKQELVYSRYLEVNNVKSLKKDFEEIDISKEDEKRILELAADQNIDRILIDSVAPGIYGHEEVKWAIALQLFGGTKGKTMKGGATIRDDIHVLLIGDPGLAKSRFLQNSADLAPKSIYVSGKTVSGVGLCVAGDSLITLNDAGMFEIGDYIESNFSSSKEELEGAFSSPIHSKPLSLGDGLGISHADSPKIWKIRPPQKLLRITTRRGKSIGITPNTQVVCIENGIPTWKKPSELKDGDMIATSRKVPPLKGKPVPLLPFIENRNVRIVSGSFDKITNALARKYGSLTAVAERYGLDRKRLYINRCMDQGVRLEMLLRMAKDAGEDASSIQIENVFIRYGFGHGLPQVLNPEICYLVGLIAGDGDIHHKGNTAFVRLHSADRKNLEAANELLKKNFAIDARITDDGKRIPSLSFGSVVLAEIFGKLGIPAGEKSDKLDIPPILVSAGEECVRAYLRGLFDTDGWVSASKNASASIGLCTCSRKLAQKALLLLEWWGITAKLRPRKDKVGKVAFIKGKKVETKKEQYYVELRGIGNFTRFRGSIGFARSDKRAKLEALVTNSNKSGNPNLDIVPILPFLKTLKGKYGLKLKNDIKAFFYKSNPSRRKLLEICSHLPEGSDRDLLQALAGSDIYWDEVVSINDEPPAGEWVYDFTVEGSHNFLANGIIVHNTVSAEKDELGDGGWTLKAGALVLASGGMAMIDEFDKIEDEDRAALHEAMESAQISIAKAGMVAKFRTKTSILAAANPKWGRFNQNKNLADQFNIAPTLLSRFDLIFPILDVLDEEKDSKLAQHILATHMGDETDYNKTAQLVDKDILRKYIAYARRNIRPKLMPQASEKIKYFYVDLRRKGQDSGSVAITPRYLEGLVRLSEASAKMRLCNVVEEKDAEVAIHLLRYVMQQVMTDKATGTLDVDTIATGKPKSERDKLQKVDTIMEIIREHLKTKDSANIEEVISDAASYDIDANTARRIIDDLLNKRNELYLKEHGQVKIVGG
jgi:DNA replicative helicase MCM subunit Mcm2 (Cdc46/Mcm family)